MNCSAPAVALSQCGTLNGRSEETSMVSVSFIMIVDTRGLAPYTAYLDLLLMSFVGRQWPGFNRLAIHTLAATFVCCVLCRRTNPNISAQTRDSSSLLGRCCSPRFGCSASHLAAQRDPQCSAHPRAHAWATENRATLTLHPLS